MDLQKHSRFVTINMMREKAGLMPLLWEKFEQHDWKLIEELTEDARIRYNEAIREQHKEV